MPDIGNEKLEFAERGFFADKADVVADGATLTEEDWHKYRTLGIGGSDAAAVLNESPWTTAYDLYLKKSGIQLEKEEVIDRGKEFIFDYGHAVEGVVANAFQRITGLEVMIDTYMYRHKKYPFMQANIDRVVRMPDGKLALLECKTTTFFNQDAWSDGKVPRYYKLQCQHYMAILDVDVCYIACIYGNTENDFVCRRIERDLVEEEALIEAERKFWEEYVETQTPPPLSSKGSLESQAVYKTLPYANKKNPSMKLDESYLATVQEWMELYQKKAEVKKVLDSIDEKLKLLAIPIQEEMQDTTKATVADDEYLYTISYSPRSFTNVDKERLRLVYPDVYKDVCATVAESSRPFSIKQKNIAVAK